MLFIRFLREEKPTAWDSFGRCISHVWQAGLGLVFPSSQGCLICDGKLPAAALVELCQSCLERLSLVGDNRCERCGRPQPRGQEYCRDCAELQHFFVRNRAVAIYDGALKEQIQEVKYQYNRQLGLALGQIMGVVASRRRWVPRNALLLPVPLHPTRLRRRGYNQAELLLRGVEQYLNRPILEPGIVIRSGASGASNRLSPRERRANLRGVFEVLKPPKIAGKVLCVVDDIYTTGATLDEMARTLLHAGAEAVYGLTLAIAIKDQDILGIAPIATGTVSAGGAGVEGRI